MVTRLVRYKKIEKVTTYVYGMVETQFTDEVLSVKDIEDRIHQFFHVMDDSETLYIEDLTEINLTMYKSAERGE